MSFYRTLLFLNLSFVDKLEGERKMDIATLNEKVSQPKIQVWRR